MKINFATIDGLVEDGMLESDYYKVKSILDVAIEKIRKETNGRVGFDIGTEYKTIKVAGGIVSVDK